MRKTIDLVNQSTDAVPSAEDVFEAIHAVMHRYRAQQYRLQREGGQDLTHMDGKVLGFFARHPGATQTELAAHAGRDKGQLARLVAGLRERGLLEGRADDADRRSIRLALSAEGRAVQQALQRRARRVAERATAGLDGGERLQLVALLGKVARGIDDTEP